MYPNIRACGTYDIGGICNTLIIWVNLVQKNGFDLLGISNPMKKRCLMLSY